MGVIVDDSDGPAGEDKGRVRVLDPHAFAQHFALDLYGRGLLTSDQSRELAHELEHAVRAGLPENPHLPESRKKALAAAGEATREVVRKPEPDDATVEKEKFGPLIVTNIEGAIIYKANEGHFYVIDPKLPLPEGVESQPLIDLRYNREAGHFYDLAFASNEEVIVPMTDDNSDKGPRGGYEISDEGRDMGFGPQQVALDDDGPEVRSDVPAITVKPGWQTSQGQMTGLFVLAAVTLAGVFGIKLSMQRVQTIAEGVTQAAVIVGALLAAWRQLETYTNSRGKTQSNAVWANASLLNPAVRNDNLARDHAALTQEYKALAGVQIHDLADVLKRQYSEGVNAGRAGQALLEHKTPSPPFHIEPLMAQVERLQTSVDVLRRDLGQRSEEMGQHADGVDEWTKETDAFLNDIAAALVVLAHKALIDPKVWQDKPLRDAVRAISSANITTR